MTEGPWTSETRQRHESRDTRRLIPSARNDRERRACITPVRTSGDPQTSVSHLVSSGRETRQRMAKRVDFLLCDTGAGCEGALDVRDYSGQTCDLGPHWNEAQMRRRIPQRMKPRLSCLPVDPSPGVHLPSGPNAFEEISNPIGKVGSSALQHLLCSQQKRGGLNSQPRKVHGDTAVAAHVPRLVENHRDEVLCRRAARRPVRVTGGDEPAVSSEEQIHADETGERLRFARCEYVTESLVQVLPGGSMLSPWTYREGG